MKSIVFKTFLVSLVILLQGCMPDSLTKFKEETKPQKTSSGGTVVDNPPSSLSYSPATFKFIKNNPVVPVLPTTAGVVESFSITPALPAGLAFDVATGRIFGTPTTYSPENTYVVTATNSVGSLTTNVKISIFTQPAGLRFTSTPKVKITLDDASAFTVGSLISVQPLNSATLSGTVSQILGNILEVTVSSSNMGTPVSPVAGISRMVDDAATYAVGVATITDFQYTSKVQLKTSLNAAALATAFPVYSPASNALGAIGQVLDLSSSSVLIGVISGSFNPSETIDNVSPYVASETLVNSINYVFKPGDQIDLRPSVTDGESIEYSISPDLPAEFLAFSTTTGIIQGTQAGTTSLSYTITVTNPVGSVATSLSIGPFIAAPENLNLSNELLLTLNNNAKFFRGRPISSSDDGKGIVLKRFSDGKTIMIRHQEGAFNKDASVDDALTYGGEEAVIQKSETINLKLRIANAAGYENSIDSVATASTGGTGIISYVDLTNNDIYLKYLAGSFSDTSASVASTLSVAALVQNITRVESTNVRMTITGASAINTRFDKGFHVTSSTLAAGLIQEVIGTGATADLIIKVSNPGFVDGGSLDNYSPYVASEATTSKIAYEHAFYLYTTEKAVLTPTLPKGDNITYSISPDLPAGLVLDTTTGLISGQPTEPSILKSYILTAKNISDGLQQQATHQFKLRVHDDFGIFNTLSEATSTLMHREGMGLNIEQCRLTKDQLQNGKNYARIVVSTPHTFTVGSDVSNQFGATGTVEELIQDPAITSIETLIVRIQNGSFSQNQNIDDAAVYVAPAAVINAIDKRAYNRDIACRLEVSENDLWALGAQFNIKAGKGICDYISYTPYFYYRYPAHQTTTNTVVIKEVDNSAGLCAGSYVYTGALDEQKDFKCAGDWRDDSLGAFSGPNCDGGTYISRTITYSGVDTNSDGTPDLCDVGPNNDVVTECGGNQYACVAGGARDLPAFQPENNIFSVQLETSQGSDSEQKLTGPQDLSPLRSSNRYLANYVANNSCTQSLGNPSEALHQGKTYNYSIENWKKATNTNLVSDTGLTVAVAVTDSATITTSGDPTPFITPGMSIRIGGVSSGVDYRVLAVSATDITLHARVKNIAMGEAIRTTTFKNDPLVGSSPFYEISCLDPGADTIGRIYLQVREWDRFFSPEDDVDVLSQRLMSGTVDMSIAGTTVASTGAADNDVFTLLNNNDQRMLTVGIENHTVDFLDNFSVNALDTLETTTAALTTQAAVSAWIRPLKLDSGDGVDSFGGDYNDYLDWDDSNNSIHPALYGCAVQYPRTNEINDIQKFAFPQSFD